MRSCKIPHHLTTAGLEEAEAKERRAEAKQYLVYVQGFTGWTTVSLNASDKSRLLAMADNQPSLLTAASRIAAQRVVAAGKNLRGSFSRRVRDETELIRATCQDPYELAGLLEKQPPAEKVV